VCSAPEVMPEDQVLLVSSALSAATAQGTPPENQLLCSGAGWKNPSQAWELVPPLRTPIPKSSSNPPPRGRFSHPLLPQGLLGPSQGSLPQASPAQPGRCSPAAPCSGEEEEAGFPSLNHHQRGEMGRAAGVTPVPCLLAQDT